MLHLCSPQVLLEPVRDAATMEQVVARAHRLGATGPVRVETLVVLLAQQHEAQCPRNPANATRLREADAASSGGVPRLESLYRAIKPPPPMATSADAARTTA
jgi:hypothetical protein